MTDEALDFVASLSLEGSSVTLLLDETDLRCSHKMQQSLDNTKRVTQSFWKPDNVLLQLLELQ